MRAIDGLCQLMRDAGFEGIDRFQQRSWINRSGVRVELVDVEESYRTEPVRRVTIEFREDDPELADMVFQWKPISAKQRIILARCSGSTHLKTRQDEDVARQLVLRGLLQRVRSPVLWQRRYQITKTGRVYLENVDDE